MSFSRSLCHWSHDIWILKPRAMFSQRGGLRDCAPRLTQRLAARNAPGDCLFPQEAFYPDIYHILIDTNFILLILLFHILPFCLANGDAQVTINTNTCLYSQPVGINMYCYVHPFLKTAAYRLKGIKLGLRDTSVRPSSWDRTKPHTAGLPWWSRG